jgi:hypothetical protein
VSTPLRALLAGALLSLVPGSPGEANEWETIRERQENVLRTQVPRSAEVEARERGARAEQEKRAEKVGRDRLAGAEGILKGGDWRADGAERRKARESMVTLQRNLERANASLSRAIEIAESTTTGLSHSGVLERLARLEHEQKARAVAERSSGPDGEKQQRERAAKSASGALTA